MTAITRPPKSLRATLHNLAFNQDNKDGYSGKIDAFIAVLIVTNLLALILETIPVIHDANPTLFAIFDKVSVIIFTLEYLARFYVAPEDKEFSLSRSPRVAYVKSPFAIIDLLAILPFYLSALFNIDLRVLRALRLLRLLKLFRILAPAYYEFKALNRGKTFRQQIYALLNPTETSGRLHGYIDIFIVSWVLISVSAIILESVQSVETVFHLEFAVLDTVAVMIFSVEYMLRIYSCVEDPLFKGAVAGRMRYAKSPIAIIDFLAVIPFYLEFLFHSVVDLRFLRIFRLLGLLKLTRYTTATTTLLKALRREWPVIGASTFIMLLLVVLTASLGYLFEHQAQPEKYENIPQSIYWAVVTLASVGYGDISPITPVGRLMTVIMALVGIGIFAVPAAILSSAFNDQLHKDREQMHNELYKFMEDGILDEAERTAIYKEARRLHITEDEVNILIERVKQEREATASGHLPFDLIKKEPEVAFEQFRQVVGQLRQIASVSQTDAVSRLFSDVDRATNQEREIWEKLSKGPKQ